MSATEIIVETIKKICAPEKPDLSDPDKSLLSGALDSLDFASVVMALEDEFSISFQDVEIEHLNTINKLASYVDAHRKG